MSKKIEFYVSAISDNPKNLFRNLEIYQKKGISGIHFDVMDGVFVPRLGLYPELLREIRKETDLPIEVHLMTINPNSYLEDLVSSGANRIIIHLESVVHVHRVISEIKKCGVEVGIALNPSTTIENLEFIMNEIDVVLLMSINPGIPKHSFIPSTIPKLKKLKKFIESYKTNNVIAIDGGVTFDNLNILKEFGANRLVCGSGTIFNLDRSLEENLELLSKARLK